MNQQHVRRRFQRPEIEEQALTADSPQRCASPEERLTLTKQAVMIALYVIIIVDSLVSATFSPIGDCDEVYNYWEPTHYLLYGSGMQTWEYSPTYGLRSYLYIFLHALIGALVEPFAKWLYPLRYRNLMFFAIRYVFGLCHAFTMIRLVIALRKKIGFRYASAAGLFAALSPGIFQASTSYLPQSFSMYAVTLAFASFIEDQGPFGCIFWMGVAGLVGWPFVGILAVCLAVPLVHRYGMISCIQAALFTAVLCLVPSLIVDYYFYRKWMLAVLNIIKYNVFTSHGADLFGVEPWHYFIRNLFLNFNVVFLAYLLVFPVAGIVWWYHRNDNGNSYQLLNRENPCKSELINASKKAIIYLWPTAVFLIIFTSMAHKEERFLYPIYPMIAVGGAIAFYLIMMLGMLPFSYEKFASVFTIICVLLSCSRKWSNAANYSAPIPVFAAIPPETAKVCVGKEWYRFPSSFFLPTPDSELLYLKSEFSGLLPRPFSRLNDGTRVIPPGMNDLNKEEPDRYSDISQCDFIVDLDLPHQQEPHYDRLKEFKVVYKAPFLDASRTPWWCRAFWLPFLHENCRADAKYQLLQRIRE